MLDSEGCWRFVQIGIDALWAGYEAEPRGIVLQGGAL